MEVIRNADVARLVLGYLRDQNLEKASNIFCKTSPYLEDEYRLIQKGLRPAIKLGSGQLVAIIKEHCEISAKIDQLVDSLPQNVIAGFPKQLSSRISYITKIVKKSFGIKDKAPPKRRRSIDSVETGLETTSVRDLPGYSPSITKRRRMSGSSYLIVNTQSQANSDLEGLTDEENNSGNTSNSSEPDTVLNHPNSSKNNVTQSPKEKTLTSTDTSAEIIEVPTFSAISETLLENTEFQTKLAGYINKALQDSSAPPSAEKNQNREGINRSENTVNPNNDLINEQLDDAIKNILAAIDNDPISDKVIEDIIISPANKFSVSTDKGTQMTPLRDEELEDKIVSLNKNVQSKVDMQISTAKQTEPLNKTINYDKGTQMTPFRDEINTNDEPNYPNATDEGITNGIAVAATSNIVLPNQAPVYQKSVGDTTLIDTTASSSNNIFKTPIVDSSGALAKFFIVNSKDGIETPLIGNPMLSNTSCSNVQGYSPYSDQILMDLNTGQISIPLYMANESLNFPMIINNNIAQQLQDGNINLENSRIEIPVTIEAAPDCQNMQQSGNEVIEITTADGLKLFQSSAIKQNPPSSLPPLLEPRISDDKSTPSANIIVQTNKSLSTPRRRMSHVRVLNFATPSKAITSEQRNEPVLSHEVVLDQENINKLMGNIIQTNVVKSPILNEGSNSNSLDIGMDKSNDTVIHKCVSETPRRKSIGFGCVRNISRSNSLEEENQDKKAEDANSKKQSVPKTLKKSLIPRTISTLKSEKTQEPKSTAEGAAPIDDWQRYRSIDRSNFDQYLREVCSSSGLANTVTRRRKKKKNIKKLNESQTKAEKSATKKSPAKRSSNDGKTSKNTSAESLDRCQNISKKETIKKNLQVKQATPKVKEKSLQKNTKIEKSNSKHASSKKKNVKAHSSTEKTEKKNDSFNEFKNPPPCPSAKKVKISKEALDRELQKRTADIGCLLQTPFKEDLPNIPSTPIETPITKMLNSLRPVSNLKNPEVPTPTYAITPGANLNTTEKDTPRSGMWSTHATDYSSGGSYYKPDESEDLDRHLDRLLTTQRQSRRNEQSSKDSSLPNSSLEKSLPKEKENKGNSPAKEEVKVECPVVLERVKSFTEEIPQVVPHYTFVAKDLPEDESSDSDSSSSSSSSSSGSSSNSSSSSACSKSKLSLSDINSSEDEEWKQQSADAVNNPNLLIAEDGEVRYPVRSWITPKKAETNAKSQSSKSESKIAKKLSDLEEKRLRVKAKLKGDLKPPAVKLVKKPPPRTVSRKIIRQKIVTTNQVQNAVENTCSEPIVENEQDKQINMLKALNLSKRVVVASTSKTLPKETTSKAGKTSENLTTKIEIVSKAFIREESRESCESEQIRNAAMVLTNMQKRAKHIDPIKVTEHKKKGRPCKKDHPSATKATRTLQMSLRNKKSKIVANTKSVKNTRKSNDIKKITPIKKPSATKGKVTSKAVKTRKKVAPPIQISEIRSSVDDCENVKKDDRSDPSRMIEESPIVTSNTAPDEEKSSSGEDDDEDPYDLCEIKTVDEYDEVHFKHFIYDGPCGDTSVEPAFESIENLSSSVMNIFLDDKQHILKVHDEIELFSVVPKIKTKIVDGKKPIKNVPKKRQRKAHIEPSSKKDSPTECQQNLNEENVIPLHSSTPVQSTYRANTRIFEDLQETDRTGIESEQPNDNQIYDATASASAASAESHSQMIKPEDIYAVLSHLHGEDGKVD